jgi:hypothetical protein
MAVYSFYSGDEDIVFGELSERAGGIDDWNIKYEISKFEIN